jgi:hypothetical protein
MVELPRLPLSADPKLFHPALKWWIETSARYNRIPRRADLLPEYLGAPALPYVLLVDILCASDDFRFRLTGTKHVEFNQRDLTGVLYGDLFPKGSAALAHIKNLYTEMILARRPLWIRNDAFVPAREHSVHVTRLMLPMSQDSDDIDLCLAVQTYDKPKNTDAKALMTWLDASSIREIERELL